MVASRKDLREMVGKLFESAVGAAIPRVFMSHAITQFFPDKFMFVCASDYTDYIKSRKRDKDYEDMNIGDKWSLSYSREKPIHLVSVGKASLEMTMSAVYRLGELGVKNLPSALVISHKGAGDGFHNDIASFFGKIDVIQAAHPFPDERSVVAGEALIKKFQSVPKGEVILLLLSGGGSSLAVAPADGITLQDKIATTELLFKAGANIKELNCVRKHLSKIKGGQLAQMTKATIHTITLSDVFDDDPSSIASGIAYPDKTTFQEAYDIMHKYKLWDDLPASVQKRLQDGSDGKIADTPSDSEQFHHLRGYIAASNKQSVKAVTDRAAEISSLFPNILIGDASDGAKSLINQTQKNKLHIEVTGGETTVNITGDGVGGRNQHMALAFALQAEEQKLHERYPKWAFLSGGTDGRDGPTEAAGGVVDHESLHRMRKAGIDPQKELDNCNSNHALAASGDLIPRDDTGTNVGDIQIFIGDPHG